MPFYDGHRLQWIHPILTIGQIIILSANMCIQGMNSCCDHSRRHLLGRHSVLFFLLMGSTLQRVHTIQFILPHGYTNNTASIASHHSIFNISTVPFIQVCK